ncbi:MAG TPA: archaeosortase/exosortase family protein [Mycobacteriales bacterium]|nr:archaeosortase/exosortase family protein [Mycobacteriales bacterium]
MIDSEAPSAVADQATEPVVTGRSTLVVTMRGRAVLMVIIIAVVYWPALKYTYVGLRSFDPSSPLVFVPFVPFAALAVASTRWRGSPDEPAPLPQRGADFIIGGFFLIAAWLTAFEAPRIFSTETLAWRADFLSLAPFTAGMIALIYGGRMLFRLRPAVLLLTAMAPGFYRPVLAPLRSWLDSATFVLLGALQHVLRWYHAAANAQGQYVTLHGAHTFTVSVTQACAGGGAVLGGLLLASTVSLLTTGSLRRKLVWASATVVLCWLGNFIRLLVLFVVGYRYDLATMMGSLHDWLGAIFLSLSLSVGLLLIRPMGLAFVARAPHRLPARCLTRFGAGTVVAAVVAALAIAVPSAAATTRFDFFAGRSRTSSQSAQAAVAAVPGVQALAPIEWAPAYFGAGARWSRWLVFGRSAAGTLPISIDIVHSVDAARFDTYGLAACYGFHGYRLIRQATTALPGGRVGESIVYWDRATGANVTVLAWRQRLAGGGFERVVIQHRSAQSAPGDLQAVGAVALGLLGRVDGTP